VSIIAQVELDEGFAGDDTPHDPDDPPTGQTIDPNDQSRDCD
jgi:hypothetical protein